MFTQDKIVVDPCVAQEVIKLFRELDRGRGGSMGTWHGARLRGCPYPWFQATYDRVAAAVAPLQIDLWWFNCGERGDEYRWHSHNPYERAAVLYVQVPKNSGGLEFKRFESYETFMPDAGDFITFSGDLAHRVQSNKSDDYRISVAFNLKEASGRVKHNGKYA